MPNDTPWLGLAALVDDVGAKNLHRLIAATGGAEAAWGADRAALGRAGVSQRAAERFLEIRASVDVNAIAAAVDREGIAVIPWGDPQYPPLLTQIPDPPIVLFVRGNVGAIHTRALGVVGTRNATVVGRSAAEVLVAPLARAGLTITSGLAYGIDAAAHAATLRAGGCTVAVLGTGIDEPSIYPPAHRRLAREIVDHGGCLVTEFVPGTPGLPLHFPARNRIIAGLTVGTLVIEAPEASGALITARFALDFGREVFAVPGAITNPVSAGCNALLKTGACLVTTASDIIDALHLEELLPPTPKRATPADGLARRVYDVLGTAPKHIDDLQNELGVATPELAHTLTSLEMDGAIRDIGGSRYMRAP